MILVLKFMLELKYPCYFVYEFAENWKDVEIGGSKRFNYYQKSIQYKTFYKLIVIEYTY